MSSRILTVSGLYVSPSCSKPVPAVRVQGKWLENIGFSIGCKVEIQEGNGEIVIKLASPANGGISDGHTDYGCRQHKSGKQSKTQAKDKTGRLLAQPDRV